MDQVITWLNVRLVRSQDGYVLVATDAEESKTDLDKIKFQVMAICPNVEVAEFLGKCLAEVNDVPFLDERKYSLLLPIKGEEKPN